MEEKKPNADTKKPEETNKEAKEESKKDEAAASPAGGGGGDGVKKDGGVAAAPPLAEEVVMRVYMHCEGCARKVKRCLKGFEGVEEVKTDCRTHEVVVKGRKAAEDPMKVVERVQKKSGRKVELLSALPPPKPEPKPEEKKKEEETPKPEEKKEPEPPVITVVLKVHMHCDACAQEMKKGILKMKGVQAAEPELKASQVMVKGVFEAAKLVEYVYKRTGKHAVVVKQEPEVKKPEGEAEKKEEGKDKDKDKEKVEGEKKAEGGGGGGGGEDKEKEGEATDAAAGVKAEMKRNEFVYYYPRVVDYNAYPPQMFSDENPNACSLM